MKGITNELIGAASSSMIMTILKDGDSYGYEIVQRMREMTDGKLKLQTTIYLILQKLEKEKNIISYWKFDDGEHPKKYYNLLDKGLKQLNQNKGEWLYALNILRKTLG